MTGGLADAALHGLSQILFDKPGWKLGEASWSLMGPYSECSISTQTKESLSTANAKDRQATF